MKRKEFIKKWKEMEFAILEDKILEGIILKEEKEEIINIINEFEIQEDKEIQEEDLIKGGIIYNLLKEYNKNNKINNSGLGFDFIFSVENFLQEEFLNEFPDLKY